MKKNKQPKNTKTIEQMSLYELSRWSALIDAVNIIADKCEEKHTNLEKYLNPLGIQRYVDTATDDILYKHQDILV